MMHSIQPGLLALSPPTISNSTPPLSSSTYMLASPPQANLNISSSSTNNVLDVITHAKENYLSHYKQLQNTVQVLEVRVHSLG